MKQKTINYKEIKKLGFEIGYLDDKVHQDQHGYDDFWAEFKLNERFSLTWEHSTRFAELTRIGECKMGEEQDQTIQIRIPVIDLADLQKYLFMFGHLTKEQYSPSTPDISGAC